MTLENIKVGDRIVIRSNRSNSAFASTLRVVVRVTKTQVVDDHGEKWDLYGHVKPHPKGFSSHWSATPASDADVIRMDHEKLLGRVEFSFTKQLRTLTTEQLQAILAIIEGNKP